MWHFAWLVFTRIFVIQYYKFVKILVQIIIYLVQPICVDHAIFDINRNSIMKVALVLIFAASVTGQGIICSKRLPILDAKYSTQPFLVSPQLWESNVFTYYQGENQEPSAVRRGKFSYDAQNLRRRFIEEIDTSRTDREYYDELYLYKEVNRIYIP